MSEVEGTEIIEDVKIEIAPAEELVEMILSGELHAANEKFSELVEGKVIEAIEEEKHKIAQTLFAEEEIEEAVEESEAALIDAPEPVQSAFASATEFFRTSVLNTTKNLK